MSDNKIKIALIAYIIIAIIFLMSGSATCIAVLNMLSAAVTMLFWLVKYYRFRHQVEFREIIFLSVQFLLLVPAVYFIVNVHKAHWLAVCQYAIASLHLTAAILLLAFMLVFKMKKLF